MAVVFERFQPCSLMPTSDDVTWWSDLAETVDRLRADVGATFHLGAVPAELKSRADVLARQTEALQEELTRLRYTVAQHAGEPDAVRTVRDLARETFGEWERHARRVSRFITDAHWRDVGVAG